MGEIRCLKGIKHFKIMAKTKEQKKEILDNLADKIKKAKSIVFTKFDGLEVKENEELRNNLRQQDSEYYVAKKTLLDRAFKKQELKDVDIKNMDGKVAVVFGYEDEVAPARIIDEFRKEHKADNGKKEKIDFIGGVLENKFLTAEEITALAKLPSKQELYAKIVGSIKAPVSGFVNVLAGNLRGLVNVLTAIKDKNN